MAAIIGSKRVNQEVHGFNQQNKMPRGDKMKVRVLIWSKFVGAIVGKGGQIVKSLRDTHGVQFDGLKATTEKRVLSLSGQKDGIVNVMKDLLPVVGADAPNPVGKDGNKLPCEVNLLVPIGFCGAVIGKSGMKIKEIMNTSGCRVQVYADDLPNSTERVVAVGGSTADKVAEALNILFILFEKLPKIDDLTEYDPTQDPDVKESAGTTKPGEKIGSVVVGRGSVTSQLITGTQLAGAYQLSLNPQQVNTNQNIYSQISTLFQQQQQLKQVPTLDLFQAKGKLELELGPEMVGALIGKGGASIKQVKSATGVEITIEGNEKGSKANRKVTITGKQGQINQATQMFAENIKNYQR